MGGKIVTKPARRRRLGLRLWVVMALVVPGAAWLGWVTNRARRQAEAIRVIERAGGSITFDYQLADPHYYDRYTFAGQPKRLPPVPPGPAWLRRLVGDEYFREVKVVQLGRTIVPDELLHAAVASLEKCPHVEQVFLVDCLVEDADFDHLAHLPSLTTLGLRGADCRKVGGFALGKLRTLQKLDVTSTIITDAQIASVGNLRRLEELRLSWLASPGVGDEGLAAIAPLRNLRQLDLVDNLRITSDGCRHLAGLTKLEWLDLEGTRVGDAGMPSLEGLQSLRELRLEDTAITDAGLRPLARLKSLYVLRVNDSPVTREGVDRLKNSLPNLRFLFSSYN